MNFRADHPSRSASKATSRPILFRYLKQSATVYDNYPLTTSQRRSAVEAESSQPRSVNPSPVLLRCVIGNVESLFSNDWNSQATVFDGESLVWQDDPFPGGDPGFALWTRTSRQRVAGGESVTGVVDLLGVVLWRVFFSDAGMRKQTPRSGGSILSRCTLPTCPSGGRQPMTIYAEVHWHSMVSQCYVGIVAGETSLACYIPGGEFEAGRLSKAAAEPSKQGERWHLVVSNDPQPKFFQILFLFSDRCCYSLCFIDRSLNGGSHWFTSKAPCAFSGF